ncbi:MAG: phosphopantetheine-binding protein, partial [Acidimicrobiales bacterium]
MATIRELGILEVSRLDCDQDLYRLGLTSMGTVELMVELEAKFGVEFP